MHNVRMTNNDEFANFGGRQVVRLKCKVQHSVADVADC